MTPSWTLVAVLAGLVAALLLALWWSAGRERRLSRRRQRHGERGERRAEKLLRRAGYRIEEQQPEARWTMAVDGEPVRVMARADFLVSGRDGVYVAEVKTGHRGPDPTFAKTRRQLLEYALAYDVDGVLLVDADGGEVLEVDFPDLIERDD